MSEVYGIFVSGLYVLCGEGFSRAVRKREIVVYLFEKGRTFNHRFGGKWFEYQYQ